MWGNSRSIWKPRYHRKTLRNGRAEGSVLCVRSALCLGDDATGMKSVEKRDESSFHAPTILKIRFRELAREEGFFRLELHDQEDGSHPEHTEIPHAAFRQAAAEHGEKQAGVDRMAHESVRAALDEFMVILDAWHRTPVRAKDPPRPNREPESSGGKNQPDVQPRRSRLQQRLFEVSGNCRHPSHRTRTAASAVNRLSGLVRVAVRLFPRAEASQNTSHPPQSAASVLFTTSMDWPGSAGVPDTITFAPSGSTRSTTPR